MENFFNWMSKPIPTHEVEVWFQIHNIFPEKVELYGDIFQSLSIVIRETYLGDSVSETRIVLTTEDITNHFDWCWKKTLKDFELENLSIDADGNHKDYFKNFFNDSFYRQNSGDVRNSIPKFINELFDLNKPFAKSDLDILTEIYKLLDKHVSYSNS